MKSLKVMCVISWILIAFVAIGFLMEISDGEFDGVSVVGVVIYAFYGTMTYKIQKLMKDDVKS